MEIPEIGIKQINIPETKTPENKKEELVIPEWPSKKEQIQL